jgi:ketosteroid isomerase-like protein
VKTVIFVLLGTVAAHAACTADLRESSDRTAAIQKELIAIVQAWAKAEEKRDAAKLTRILDDRFIVTVDADSPMSKEQYIRWIANDEMYVILSQLFTDETVVVDRDTAVFLGTDTIRGTDKGVSFAQKGRFTVTFVRRDGRWVALAEHFATAPGTR